MYSQAGKVGLLLPWPAGPTTALFLPPSSLELLAQCPTPIPTWRGPACCCSCSITSSCCRCLSFYFSRVSSNSMRTFSSSIALLHSVPEVGGSSGDSGPGPSPAWPLVVGPAFGDGELGGPWQLLSSQVSISSRQLLEESGLGTAVSWCREGVRGRTVWGVGVARHSTPSPSHSGLGCCRVFWILKLQTGLLSNVCSGGVTGPES
jgi:hypothetical protein